MVRFVSGFWRLVASLLCLQLGLTVFDNLDATDVAVMLSLFKVSRVARHRKYDSVLDFASYADLALKFENEGEI